MQLVAPERQWLAPVPPAVQNDGVRLAEVLTEVVHERGEFRLLGAHVGPASPGLRALALGDGGDALDDVHANIRFCR